MIPRFKVQREGTNGTEWGNGTFYIIDIENLNHKVSGPYRCYSEALVKAQNMNVKEYHDHTTK
jgi:hypothetical protein